MLLIIEGQERFLYLEKLCTLYENIWDTIVQWKIQSKIEDMVVEQCGWEETGTYSGNLGPSKSPEET